MKAAVINLYKPIDSTTFTRRLVKLFSRVKFYSNFIEAHVELTMKNGDIINLNEYMIFNTIDCESIMSFAINNEQSFISIFKKATNEKFKVKIFILFYIESDEMEFKTYIHSLKFSNKLDKKNLLLIKLLLINYSI